MEDRLPRKLAAILYADVAGYSRLTGDDEEGTHRRLSKYLDLISDGVTEHHGRVVHYAGDAVLADFGTVTDSLTCATAIQRSLASQNQNLPDERKVQFRIGVNLGEVIVDRDDVYGDGVNVAARLEALADPGGICISDAVRTAVGKKLNLSYEYMGEQQVKNIDEPVRAYRVTMETQEQPKTCESLKPELELPDKPSIAVLPFTNMSGDPEQEYFSDGITEDIITALSHFRELLVIARNTSFSFKGKTIRIDQVCKELNVRYALEGSVRKAANRVRVTAQLVDGHSDSHLWAERFDRNLDDIFLVQDEITNAIVAAVAPRTLSAEVKRAQGKTVDHLSARERVMRARWHINKLTKADNEIAHILLNEAIAESPDLAEAYTTRAECLLNDILHVWRDDTDVAIGEALDASRSAVSLDPEDANGLAVLGSILMWARQFEDAREYLERAVRLNPNLANAYGLMAAWHGICGDYEKSCEVADKALEISPLDSSKPLWLGGRGIAAYIHGDYEHVIETAQRLLRDHPGFASALRQLAASFAMLGRDDEAKAATQKLLERMPGLTVSKVRHIVPVRDPAAHERWLEGLRKAGLPE
ncbi:MAG: adenylate/guanylate cyclase domain-containing protein [Gammaproteobacteria bacterium]|nr:adenylate/guanylate cyclase domain-containing protein [Gammaproteobacteria bacterium]